MNQHNKDIENMVLGALMLEPFRMPAVSAILKDEYFYLEASKHIYRAIKALYDENETIDIMTVTLRLRKNGRLEECGGAFYVSNVTSRVASGENIEAHARKIHEYHMLRSLWILGNKLQNRSESQNADCFDIIEDCTKELEGMTRFMTNSVKTVGSVFVDLLKEMNDVLEGKVIPGVPSGFSNIDKFTNGWQKGNSIIIAARPGMGKTAFAVCAAKNSALKYKKPVAIFSLEMTALELVGRMASSESDIDSARINQKRLDHKELRDLGDRCYELVGAPIYIDDTPGLSYSDLRSKAKLLHHDKGIELIIIDYLQLMHGDLRGNREQEISYISRGIKALAKELNIPVIALSQLSRKVEDRPDKRPQLSDLRESGSIEQDADMVMFLFRPEEYDLFPDGYDIGKEILPVENLLLVDIAKGRAIKKGEVALKFYGSRMSVTDYGHVTEYTETNSLTQNTDFLNT